MLHTYRKCEFCVLVRSLHCAYEQYYDNFFPAKCLKPLVCLGERKGYKSHEILHRNLKSAFQESERIRSVTMTYDVIYICQAELAEQSCIYILSLCYLIFRILNDVEW